jgi:uncharacterized protein (TIGR02145 family)
MIINDRSFSDRLCIALHVYEKDMRICVSILLIAGMVLTFLISCERDDVNILSNCENSAVFNPNKNYGTLIDQEGNVYRTITIGSQTWMAENLRTTIYRNGDPIPNVTDSLMWINLNTGAYCTYNNTVSTDTICTYGRLYNWYALNDDRNIAPDGWHVPTLDEWLILENYLGNDTIAVEKLREEGYIHWKRKGIIAATNESGFTAIPGGYRPSGFISIGESGNWWTATEVIDYNNLARQVNIGISSQWFGACQGLKI